MTITTEEFSDITSKIKNGKLVLKEVLPNILNEISVVQAYVLNKEFKVTKDTFAPYLEKFLINSKSNIDNSVWLLDIGFSKEELGQFKNNIKLEAGSQKNTLHSVRPNADKGTVIISEKKLQSIYNNKETGKGDELSQETYLLVNCSKQERSLAKICPKGYRIVKINALIKDLPHFIKEASKGTFCLTKSREPKIKDIFDKYIHSVLLERERHSWQIVIDETGTWKDYEKKQDFPSVMLAVLIPPGVNLKPPPSGYHATNKFQYFDTTNQLREEIIKNTDVIIFALEYKSGSPTALIDKSFKSSDIHVPLWKNILLLSLEIISQRISNDKNTIVHTYIEQACNIKPRDTQLFAAYLEDLAVKCEGRKGWGNLKLISPEIIRKDEHPYLSYADSLGHIFGSTQNTPPLMIQKIKERKNTFHLGYYQEEMIDLSAILTELESQKIQALSSLASQEEAFINRYRFLLKDVIAIAVNNLSVHDASDLCDELAKKISQRPECYEAVSFILSTFPENLSDCITDKQLKFDFNLSRLASNNHRGVVPSKALIDDLFLKDFAEVNINSKFRYAILRADIYNNQNEFDKALHSIGYVFDDAMKYSKISPYAVQVFGFQAMTLALQGRSRSALEILIKYENLQITPSDRERWHVYKANIYSDLKNFDMAKVELKLAEDVLNFDTISSAHHSQYFRQALMKLEMLKPFIADKDLLKELCELSFGDRHPYLSIAYSSLKIAKREGFDCKYLNENLNRLIFKENLSCQALIKISSIYYLQAVEDNFITSDKAFEAKLGYNFNKNMNLPFLDNLYFNYR